MELLKYQFLSRYLGYSWNYSHFCNDCYFLLHGVICASWVNETGLGRLSKVVQQVWNYSHINFVKIAWIFVALWAFISWNYCATHGCLFSLYSIISPLWLNETCLERLSKVVQQVWNCSNINSYQDILNIHETTRFL